MALNGEGVTIKDRDRPVATISVAVWIFFLVEHPDFHRIS